MTDAPNPLNCPECDNPLKTEKELKKGLLIECSACGTENEIISLDPLLLSPLEEEK